MWIACKDKMPEIGECCLCSVILNTGHKFVEYYQYLPLIGEEDTPWKSFTGRIHKTEVSHWSKLPPPPSQEK